MKVPKYFMNIFNLTQKLPEGDEDPNMVTAPTCGLRCSMLQPPPLLPHNKTLHTPGSEEPQVMGAHLKKFSSQITGKSDCFRQH